MKGEIFWEMDLRKKTGKLKNGLQLIKRGKLQIYEIMLFRNFREIVISAGADSGEMLMYDQPEYDPFCAASRNLTLLCICIFVLPLVIFKRWSSCTQNDCIAIRCQSLKTYLDLYVNGVFDRFPGVKFIIFWMKAMIVGHLWRIDISSCNWSN